MMVSPVDLSSVTASSGQEAINRLKQDGYNELPSSQSRSLLAIAWDIVQDPIFIF